VISSSPWPAGCPAPRDGSGRFPAGGMNHKTLTKRAAGRVGLGAQPDRTRAGPARFDGHVAGAGRPAVTLHLVQTCKDPERGVGLALLGSMHDRPP
jgi:hypothetical protein